ncbi:di-trans,poly-cis-decaprenylcistransferase [Candidatus Calescamantes bacterium]|nr:di-trans,poly-cis-decaprenylcistransferase [Candidatus Calescamantes bacterium]
MNDKSLKIPRHVAFIVDGNRRWAKAHHLPVTEGHRRGAEVVMRVIDDCLSLGIPIATFYIFSTENWKRTEKEVGFLMKLGEWWMRNRVEDLNRKGVKLKILGRIEELQPHLKDLLEESMEKTKNNTKMQVNLAINYGGRSEIVDAVKKLIREGKKDVNEEEFSRYLYTEGLPDPDLLIRTGGEMRVSNFLLYQIAYTEFYFTPVFWPDFTREEFEKALQTYSQRERRWGK